MGTVYLIGDWEKEGFFKIGVTRGSVDNRIKKLQTGNGGEIYLVKKHESKYPFFVEKRLHERYFKEHVRDEWFSLDADDIKKFDEYCQQIEDMIISLANNPFMQKILK